MTYDPNADRTYWRGQDNKRLIEAARESGHELAIALGERLEDADADNDIIADLIAERDELDRRCDMLRAELEELHAAWEAERQPPSK